MTLSDTVKVSKVDDETILLDCATSVYFGLNPVGSRMLELLLEKDSREDIVRTLSGEYDAPESLIAEDLGKLVETLKSRGLVKGDER